MHILIICISKHPNLTFTFRSDLQRNAVVVSPLCIVQKTIQKQQNVFALILHMVMGMMLPYLVIAVLNVLIIIQMAKHRLRRASMSANVDTKSEDSAQR